jgi:PAS domain S-box-containing protein
MESRQATGGMRGYVTPTLLGAAVAFLGGAVLVSWYVASIRSITPGERFEPMQYNTALGFVITGLAVVAHCLGHRKLAFWGGALAAGLGSMALAEQVTGRSVSLLGLVSGGSLFGSGKPAMSANTALCFALSGCLLVVWRAPGTRARWRVLATGVMAAALVSAGFAGLLGYVLNDGGRYGWAHLTEMDAHTAVGFLGLGTAFFVMVFRIRGEPVIHALPGWTSWTVGLGVAALSVGLWTSLTASDARLNRLAGTRAHEAAVAHTNQLLQSHLRSLRRLAEPCALPGGERSAALRREAESCVRDMPGVTSIGWLDAAGQAAWSAGSLDAAGLGALLASRPELRAALAGAARDAEVAASEPDSLTGGYDGDLLVFVPVRAEGGHKGTLVVHHDVRGFFDWVFGEGVGRAFHVALSVGGGNSFYVSTGLRGRRPDHASMERGQVAFADREWTLAGQADGLWLGTGKTAGTTLVLWFGLFLAVALVVVIRKSEQAKREATSLAEAKATIERHAAELNATHASLEEQHSQLLLKEAELTGAAREKRRVLDSLSAFLIGVDAEGRVVEWNSVAAAIFGLPDERALGRPFEQLPLPWNREQARQAVEECRASGARVRRDNVAVQPGDEKTERVVSYTVNPTQDAHGRGWVLIGSDVTERQMLETQLHHAQRLEAVGTLAAGIAHEINTPMQFVSDNLRFVQQSVEPLADLLKVMPEVLTAVQGPGVTPELAEKLRDASNGVDVEFLAAEIPAALGEMHEGVQRVTTIVRAMKDFSHPGHQGKASADLNKAIATTIAVARNEYKYVADVETDFGDVPHVECFVADLNQVFLNLLVNAAHAIREAIGEGTGKRGKIRVSTRQDGAWLEVRFADSGCGIPEKVRGKVFDQFFTTKAVGKGTGLGLAIARAVVVEKHHGTITFESELGKGTTFIVRLPLAGAAAAEPATGVGA